MTACCALLGELIFASIEGSIFRPGEHRPSKIGVDRDMPVAVSALLLLRNAAFHPAHVKGDRSGAPHVERLIQHLDGNGEGPLRKQLEASWSTFSGPDIAAFAIRMLHAAVTQAPQTRRFFDDR